MSGKDHQKRKDRELRKKEAKKASDGLERRKEGCKARYTRAAGRL